MGARWGLQTTIPVLYAHRRAPQPHSFLTTSPGPALHEAWVHVTPEAAISLVKV